MDEQIKQSAARLMDLITKGVQTTGNFAVEQLPDIAYQYILYGRVYNTFLVVMGVLIAFATLKTVVYALKKHFNGGKGGECYEFLAIVVGITGGFTSLVLLSNISDFILVWFAPKVWLIQELAKLI